MFRYVKLKTAHVFEIFAQAINGAVAAEFVRLLEAACNRLRACAWSTPRARMGKGPAWSMEDREKVARAVGGGEPAAQIARGSP